MTPVPAPEEIAPWLERASDEEAAQGAEVALAKATVYQERGDVDRAMTLLRRSLAIPYWKLIGLM